MNISKGHQQFAKFIQLMQMNDRDNVITLSDDNIPDSTGTTVMTLIGVDLREVQLYYSADNCHLAWVDDDHACQIQQLDDIPMVVGSLVVYLEGITSKLKFITEG